MIIAVTTVGMMQMTTHKIVQVVAMRHSFMSAGRTMSVLLIMRLAVVIGRASIRIGVAYGN